LNLARLQRGKDLHGSPVFPKDGTQRLLPREGTEHLPTGEYIRRDCGIGEQAERI
jgi:hypothetical protein